MITSTSYLLPEQTDILPIVIQINANCANKFGLVPATGSRNGDNKYHVWTGEGINKNLTSFDSRDEFLRLAPEMQNITQVEFTDAFRGDWLVRLCERPGIVSLWFEASQSFKRLLPDHDYKEKGFFWKLEMKVGSIDNPEFATRVGAYAEQLLSVHLLPEEPKDKLRSRHAALLPTADPK